MLERRHFFFHRPWPGYRHDRLAGQQNRTQRKNTNESRDQWPFQNVQPSGNLLDTYSGWFAATLLGVSALLTPLLTLLRPGIRVRRRRGPGHAHGHDCACGNVLPAIEIHALFLSTRRQAIAADLHAGRRHNEQSAARINRWNPYRRRGYLLQLALFRQREIKTAVGPKVSQRRLRLVLDLIFLTDNHRRAIGLKDHHVGRNMDGIRVPGRLINIHLRRSRTRRHRLVEFDPVIHRADEHWLSAKSGMVKREFTLRPALGVGNFLHPSLELHQRKFNSCRRFAGGAVHHRATNRSRFGDCRRNHNECAEQSQTRPVSAPHGALPSAERVPRGRRTCEAGTCSISGSTSAASFSRAVFIASKSPSEYFPERYSNRRSRRLS